MRRSSTDRVRLSVALFAVVVVLDLDRVLAVREFRSERVGSLIENRVVRLVHAHRERADVLERVRQLLAAAPCCVRNLNHAVRSRLLSLRELVGFLLLGGNALERLELVDLLLRRLADVKFIVLHNSS